MDNKSICETHYEQWRQQAVDLVALYEEHPKNIVGELLDLAGFIWGLADMPIGADTGAKDMMHFIIVTGYQDGQKLRNETVSARTPKK